MTTFGSQIIKMDLDSWKGQLHLMQAVFPPVGLRFLMRLSGSCSRIDIIILSFLLPFTFLLSFSGEFFSFPFLSPFLLHNSFLSLLRSISSFPFPPSFQNSLPNFARPHLLTPQSKRHPDVILIIENHTKFCGKKLLRPYMWLNI